MLRKSELFNLDVGALLWNDLRAELESIRIGPFTIQFAEDYERRFQSLTQPAFNGHRLDVSGDRPSMLPHQLPPRYATSWVCTAYAIYDDASNESSIFGRTETGEPSADYGIFDLCELLTLFSQRRVTTSQYQAKFGAAFRYVKVGIVDGVKPLHAASKAWATRDQLVINKLQMALIFHNLAASDMIETQASHFTTALNIVCDNYQSSIPATNSCRNVSRTGKNRLKELVQTAVANCDGLSEAQRDAYVKVLSSRIDQGIGLFSPNPTEFSGPCVI